MENKNNKGLIIRNMAESDAEDLLEVLGDPDVMTYIEPP